MSNPYYEDGGITIYHGNCLELLPAIGALPDLVVTDPPYGEVNRHQDECRGFRRIRNIDKGSADVTTVPLLDVIDLLLDSKAFYVWTGWGGLSALGTHLRNRDYNVRIAVWEKTNPSPMNGQHFWLSSIELCVYAKARGRGGVFHKWCESPVWRHPIVQNAIHRTEKPQSLMAIAIEASSDRGGLVIDPFMGSGTTLRAAKDLGRRAIGIELEEGHCEVAARRLEQSVFPF